MGDLSQEARNERSIRRVLRHKDSREYFTGCGWTKDLQTAKIFHDCLEAAQTCAQFRLFGIEMVLRVEGGSADLYCTDFR